jgi:hypothetical protein
MFQDTAGTTPITAAGQAVARINDKSGNGWVFTQATAANRPTYNVDANGYAYLNFDGTNDRLTSTATVTQSSSDKLYMCAAIEVLNTGTNRAVIFSGYAAAGGYAIYACGGNNGSDYGGPSLLATGTGGNGYKSIGARALGRSVVAAYIDISQESLDLEITARLNGRPALGQQGGVTLGSGNFSNQSVNIGSSHTGTLLFQGRLYGAVVRLGVLTTTQQQGLDNWMNDKSGVW